MFRSALSPETSLAVPNSSVQARASEARARCSASSSPAARKPAAACSIRRTPGWRRGAGRGAGLAGPFAESDEVVGAAGLGAGADGGLLPAAEGLALHDGAGDAAVDVEVAGLDGVEPEAHFRRVQRVQSGGEAVLDLVLDGDGVLEGLRRHDAQDRAEELGEVEVGSAAHAVADARAPELARPVQLLRLDGPAFAFAEGGEGVEELAVGGFDDRAHLAGRVLGVADLERGDGVDQLVVEALGLGHGSHEDHQRGGGALLAGVAEG